MATQLELAAIAQRAILTTPNPYSQDWNTPSNVNNQ